jgi:hypothetical protein
MRNRSRIQAEAYTQVGAQGKRPEMEIEEWLLNQT